MLAQLVEKYPEDVRVVYRHFPLNMHELAIPAAEAAEAAGIQGKFWEMHDLIFEKQDEWSVMTPEQFQTWLEEQVASLELDVEKFKADMGSEAVVNKIKEAQQHGSDIGLPGTPFLLINGRPFQGDQAQLESILGLLKLEDHQYTYCPPMVIDPQKEYLAIVKTEKGDFTIELYPDKAPMAVNSFVFLAQNDWFDGVTFHRVLPGFVAQAGDPSGTGFGGPGYGFDNETSDLKFDDAGVVGMANSGAGTNGSQFFITYKAISELDGRYTVFGKVIEGMENAEKITARNPDENPSLPPGDKILDIEIKEQ